MVMQKESLLTKDMTPYKLALGAFDHDIRVSELKAKRYHAVGESGLGWLEEEVIDLLRAQRAEFVEKYGLDTLISEE